MTAYQRRLEAGLYRPRGKQAAAPPVAEVKAPEKPVEAQEPKSVPLSEQ